MKYLCLWFLVFTAPLFAQTDPFDEYHMVVHVEQSAITLHAQDVPVSIILERVAKALGENIVVQGELNDLVSVHFNKVSTQRILQELCDTFHLHSEAHEGYIWVGKASADGSHQITQVFPLKYSQAKALQKIFDNKQVRVDERTNALVITDDPLHLAEAAALIKTLDIPVRQVFIQARILNASKGFSKSLGVSFSSPTGDDTFELTIAKVTGSISLDAHISAAEKNNQTEVLAMPKILTADQQKATIKQGKELAYEETATSGATSVRFKEAVLELSVTPHITPNQDIVLDLHVKHDVIGKLADNGQPTIDTQAINTQVRLHDGETIVLGGIYSNRHLNQHDAVPILSRIPLLGVLFKKRYHEDDKNELLVFVTPKIIEE